MSGDLTGVDHELEEIKKKLQENEKQLERIQEETERAKQARDGKDGLLDQIRNSTKTLDELKIINADKKERLKGVRNVLSQQVEMMTTESAKKVIGEVNIIPEELHSFKDQEIAE